MLLGVLSDTHGNRELLFMAADRLVALGASLLIHLGDNYADGELLALGGYPVRMVPGLWCKEYHDARVPNRIDEEIGGVWVVAAHAETDLRDSDAEAGLVLHGHTHRARADLTPGGLVVNPGHLKAPRDRGERASYAAVRLDEATITATIHELDGAVRLTRSVSRVPEGC